MSTSLPAAGAAGRLAACARLVACSVLATSAVSVSAQGSPIPPAAAPAPVPAPAPPPLQPPCVFTPAELEPVLARAPAAGQLTRDTRGIPTCVYAVSTREVRQVTVIIDERFTAERFEQRVRLAGRVASATPTLLPGVGDGAFYVAGVAGVRRGLKYIEINGLRQAAARPVTADDAATLLRLALERVPRF